MQTTMEKLILKVSSRDILHLLGGGSAERRGLRKCIRRIDVTYTFGGRKGGRDRFLTLEKVDLLDIE